MRFDPIDHRGFGGRGQLILSSICEDTKDMHRETLLRNGVLLLRQPVVFSLQSIEESLTNSE